MAYQKVTEWLLKCRHELPYRLRPEARPGVIMAIPMQMQRVMHRESLEISMRAAQTDFHHYEEWFMFKIIPGYEFGRVVVYHPEDLEGAERFIMPPVIIAEIV